MASGDMMVTVNIDSDDLDRLEKLAERMEKAAERIERAAQPMATVELAAPVVTAGTREELARELASLARDGGKLKAL